MLDVRSFREDDAINHNLAMRKCRERLAVNKRTMHRFRMEKFDTMVVIDTAWESIRENVTISAKGSLG
jgi:hypothetical protein